MNTSDVDALVPVTALKAWHGPRRMLSVTGSPACTSAPAFCGRALSGAQVAPCPLAVEHEDDLRDPHAVLAPVPLSAAVATRLTVAPWTNDAPLLGAAGQPDASGGAVDRAAP